MRRMRTQGAKVPTAPALSTTEPGTVWGTVNTKRDIGNQMNSILTFLAPPFLGAFIGYMTNYVAIRMLFRPLTPWHLFGIRIPMTPGVIPSKRHDLALNIGEMVGSHLLTSADVSRAITEKGFQSELEGLIEGKVEVLLHKELGPVATVVPERFRSYFEAGVKILRWRALKYLHRHIDSDDFFITLESTISTSVDEFLAQEFHHFLSDQNRERLFVFSHTTVERFFASADFENWLKQAASKTVEGVLEKEKSLQDLLPEEFTTILLDRLEEEAPHLLEKLASSLKEPLIQARISDAIIKAINTFSASLGPMAALLGNFLSPEIIADKVKTYLSEKGDEIAEWLFDEDVQQKVASILRHRAEEWLSIPVSTLVKDVSPDRIDASVDWFADLLLKFCRKPETIAGITDLVRQGVESQTDRSLDAIVADLFGQGGIAEGKSWASREITDIIRSPKIKKLLDSLIIDLVEQKLLAQPVGTLAALLPKDVRNSIGDYLLQQISDILVREVPGLVDSLNIKQVVAKKVDSLDLIKLEELLMGIMQEQFKYINLFGALLGFIIGLLNLLFLVNM